MVESEIPADIRATAKAVRDKLCIDCECTFDQGCGCLDALHEAILGERERCASIAEHLNGWGRDKGAGGHAMHIAKVIRRDNHQ